jgi:hypothetical protein
MDNQQINEESIRHWYDRTTSRARKLLLWSSIIAVIGGVFFFSFASQKAATFIQTANGAVTIPIAGGIWIASFVYIFLVPSREVGFRSQEWIEMAVTMMQKTIDKRSPRESRSGCASASGSRRRFPNS